jgi:molybdopterin molybdotransferase
MISYEEARRLVFAEARPLRTENVGLAEAHLRVLAADIASPRSLPPFDNSAMDGYAVRSADVAGNPPSLLAVQGKIPAGGFSTQPLGPGKAFKIMTGAALPPGADAVVPIEDIRETEAGIIPARMIRAGENVRRRGEDIAEGEPALERGTRLNAACVGFLAALGIDEIPVAERPNVGILTTGSEIRNISQGLEAGAIYDSNGPILRAQVASAGAVTAFMDRTGDDLDETVAKIEAALKGCRVVLTTGGVSMGEYDLVRDAFEKTGARRVFWKVAQKPGMPMVFDVLERNGEPRWLFGLPGNPAAVMITFEEYVRPFLKLLMGCRNPFPREIEARLNHEVRKKKGRLNFLRIKLAEQNGVSWAESAGEQGSGILKSMTAADGLALIPADAEVIPEGSFVRVHRTEW